MVISIRSMSPMIYFDKVLLFISYFFLKNNFDIWASSIIPASLGEVAAFVGKL